MAHTPGPWVVGGASGNDGEAREIAAASRTIAWSASTRDEDEGDVVTEEDDANANLIAASPDLLDAARLANQELLDLGQGSSASPALRALWAAIAKAEGRANEAPSH